MISQAQSDRIEKRTILRHRTDVHMHPQSLYIHVGLFGQMKYTPAGCVWREFKEIGIRGIP
jgi:hypothetical protein